jgi:hypothetical protein
MDFQCVDNPSVVPCREKMIRQLRILATFVSLALFWASLWSLMGDIPIAAIYEEISDDDMATLDDMQYGGYYDDSLDDYVRHVSAKWSKPWIVVCVALGYLAAGFAYMLISGALMAFASAESSVKVVSTMFTLYR